MRVASPFHFFVRIARRIPCARWLAGHFAAHFPGAWHTLAVWRGVVPPTQKVFRRPLPLSPQLVQEAARLERLLTQERHWLARGKKS